MIPVRESADFAFCLLFGTPSYPPLILGILKSEIQLNLPILSADAALDQYDVRRVW
jgi:hypothetical protein